MSDVLDDCEVCAGLGYIEGIDTCCPHCRGEGKIDWIEQIMGPVSNKINPIKVPTGYIWVDPNDGKTKKYNGQGWNEL